MFQFRLRHQSSEHSSDSLGSQPLCGEAEATEVIWLEKEEMEKGYGSRE